MATTTLRVSEIPAAPERGVFPVWLTAVAGRRSEPGQARPTWASIATGASSSVRDTRSGPSWRSSWARQVGTFGAMALAQTDALPAFFGGRTPVLSVEFWWVLAMLVGFVTNFPANPWLVQAGFKEAM